MTLRAPHLLLIVIALHPILSMGGRFCGPPFSIPETGTNNATVTVSGASDFSSIDVSLQHTFIGDLSLGLFDPGLYVTYLFARITNTNQNLTASWTFSDSATETLAQAGDCTAAVALSGARAAPPQNDLIIAGNFLPIAYNGSCAGCYCPSSLFNLTGFVDGTWTLRVVDSASGDVGNINCMSLFALSIQHTHLYQSLVYKHD